MKPTWFITRNGAHLVLMVLTVTVNSDDYYEDECTPLTCSNGFYNCDRKECQEYFTQGGVCISTEWLVGVKNDSTLTPECLACPDFMTFDKDVKKCMCIPGFLYYSSENGTILEDVNCYEPYKESPCTSTGYVLHPLNGTNKGFCEPSDNCPENQIRVTNEDGHIRVLKANTLFQGNNTHCQEIGMTGGVCTNLVLSVNYNRNGDLYSLDCVQAGSGFGVFDAPSRSCREGFKRDKRGNCRKVIK